MSKIIYISIIDKLWRVHSSDVMIGIPFLLKNTALVQAIKYINANPEGTFDEIKIQRYNGKYDIYWTLLQDKYPAKIAQLKSNKNIAATISS